MKILRLKLINKAGLHARPAAIFVQEVRKFSSQIIIKKNDKSADAKNVLQILSLGADIGDEIEILVTGSDEDMAIQAIQKLLMETLPIMDNEAK
jgi:phosphocarrier protein